MLGKAFSLLVYLISNPRGPPLNLQRHTCHLVLHEGSRPHCQGEQRDCHHLPGDPVWSICWDFCGTKTSPPPPCPIFPITPSYCPKHPHDLLRKLNPKISTLLALILDPWPPPTEAFCLLESCSWARIPAMARAFAN